MAYTTVPEELRIGITNNCNFHCKHCYVNKKDSFSDTIDVQVYLDLLDELKDYLKDLSITGGEPLSTKERTFAVCKRCKEHGIKVRVVTNGTLLTDSVIRKLKELDVDIVQIGIDSINGDFHDLIRCHGAKEMSIQAIKRCVREGMNISARFTLGKSNYNELIPAYKYLSNLGITKFKLRMLFPAGQALQFLKGELISGEEWAQAQFKIIEESLDGAPVQITQPCLYDIPVEYNAYKEACPCGIKAAYINWNGDVKYCLFDEYVIGNIKERPFLEIWESPYMKKERETRYRGESIFECSSFRILKDKYDGYNQFITEYLNSYKSLKEML